MLGSWLVVRSGEGIKVFHGKNIKTQNFSYE